MRRVSSVGPDSMSEAFVQVEARRRRPSRKMGESEETSGASYRPDPSSWAVWVATLQLPRDALLFQCTA